ncbi:hypothetical protein M441DRAFT_150247 [Trichoderma asperellum CBS 433.97]|uniref:Uncharacterized protein n=1 Tax=Trichoderma asperellum (strain ATCC 204424 / CBS 433.97 / NBRC 101777) TaxID=1042311 RepID=A0A2T3YWK4_TRIA4|nr:hypothetical protein M441DRAFT_150247 [Trichoderma asperellum CBS 433.97]PTB36920.1 hypothetical protein M441DRAFT_150247 [Trichoderma asperellum CBS 433.97]
MQVAARYLPLTILLGPLEPRAESLVSPFLRHISARCHWLNGDRNGSMAVSGFSMVQIRHRPMSSRRAKFPDRMCTSVRVYLW